MEFKTWEFTHKIYPDSAADVEILIKDIEIYREPSIDYATQV